MKKSCEGCRALRDDTFEELKCELGHKTKKISAGGVEVGLIPLEDCPKPRTWSEFDWRTKLLKRKRPKIK